MPANSTEITDKDSLSQVVAESHTSPTLIYIHNSALPSYKTFTPIFEELTNESSNQDVRFCSMDYSNTTSALMKFAPNQMPVLVAMFGDRWCRSVVGANRKEAEKLLVELKEQARKA